jgi:hypothetical protein
VHLHPQKTRGVQVQHGFEFLGYKIKRASRRLRLPAQKLRSHVDSGALYAIPREKSVRHFMDQVRALTKRSVPLTTEELIEALSTRGYADGATTTSEPTCEGSFTDLTVGSCDAGGRIGSSVGATVAGSSYPQPNSTASTGWSTWFN